MLATGRRYFSALLGPCLSRYTVGSQGSRKRRLPPGNHTMHVCYEGPSLWQFSLMWLISKVLNQLFGTPRPQGSSFSKAFTPKLSFLPLPSLQVCKHALSLKEINLKKNKKKVYIIYISHISSCYHLEIHKQLTLL